MPELSPDLTHFLTLAKAGQHPGSSCEAAAARAIASHVPALAKHLEDQALRGLCEFIGIAKVQPDRARELLED